MRDVHHWLMRALRVAGPLWFTLYFTYSLWRPQLIELSQTLRQVTLSDVTQACIVGVVVAPIIYLLGKRRGWPHKNIYDWLVPLVMSLLKPVHRERLGSLRPTAVEDSEDIDDYEEDEEGETALDRWAAKVERWSQHAMSFIFWVVGCIGANSMLHGKHVSVWGMLIRLIAVLLVVSLLALPLRYVVAAFVLAVWLDYTFVAYGLERSAADAAIIGVGLVLWSFWERWRDKIRNAPEPPPSPPPSQP